MHPEARPKRLALVSGGKTHGSRTEDASIDGRDPLRETPSVEPAERTEWNVRESDGTMVLIAAGSSPGTERAQAAALGLGRPLNLWLPLPAACLP